MTNNPVADLSAELPEWHRSESEYSILLYTLKQDGWHRGEPAMVNDLMIRIENANGSTNDLGPIADKLLAALTSAQEENERLREVLIEIADIQKCGYHSLAGDWFISRSLVAKARAALDTTDNT